MGKPSHEHRDLYLVEVLCENDQIIVGTAQEMIFDRAGELQPETDTFTVVIQRESGRAVITHNQKWYTESSWYASNPALARVGPPRRVRG